MKISINRKFENGLIFLKTLTFKKVVNSLLLRFSYHISKIFNAYIHWGKPESVSIEPTNICNLNCPECPSGNNTLTRAKLYLSESVFENQIEHLSDYLVNLQLFFQGEPFLHPKIYNFISIATKKKIYTSTSTNGHFLTPENCRQIVKSGLHKIIVSADGTTQDVYGKYRVGGSLNIVKKGIADLLVTKRELKSKTPYVIMQFVVFSTNEHQITDIKNLAKELEVDKLEIKTAQIEDFKDGNVLIPTNDRYSRYHKNSNSTYSLKRKLNFKCQRIWNGLVISADNNLLPCCFDKDAKYPFNSIDDNNIHTSWNSHKLKQFRKKVWSDYSSVNMCHNCTEGV